MNLAMAQVHTGCPTCPGGKAHKDLEAANKAVEQIRLGILEVKKKEQLLIEHVSDLYTKCEIQEEKSKDIIELLVYFNSLKLNDGSSECAIKNKKLNCLLNRKIRSEMKKFSRTAFVDEYLEREHTLSKEESKATIQSIKTYGKKRD